MADIDDDIELEELVNATVSRNNHQYNQEIYYEFEDEDEESGEIDVNNVVDDIFGDGVGVENESELGIDFENFENFDICLPETTESSSAVTQNGDTAMNINIQEPLEISKPESPLSTNKGNIGSA